MDFKGLVIREGMMGNSITIQIEGQRDELTLSGIPREKMKAAGLTKGTKVVVNITKESK